MSEEQASEYPFVPLKISDAINLEQWFHNMLYYDELHLKPRQELAEAIRQSKQSMIFACDLAGDDGKKEYVAGGWRVFWNSYKKMLDRQSRAYAELAAGFTDLYKEIKAREAINQACYYEMTDLKRPCHLVLDIEFYPECNPNSMPFEVRLHMQLDIIGKAFFECFGIVDARKRWRETWTDSSNKQKISRHVTIVLPDNLMFANWSHCSAFMRRVTLLNIREHGDPEGNPLFPLTDTTERDMRAKNRDFNDVAGPLCDHTIGTRTRVLRLPGSTKKDKARPFLPFHRYYEGQENDAAPSELRNEKGTHEELTYEFVLSAMAHQPPKDPSAVKLLHVLEPNGEQPHYGYIQPQHVSGKYVITPKDIGPGGSIRNLRNIANAFGSNCYGAPDRAVDPFALKFDEVSEHIRRFKLTRHQAAHYCNKTQLPDSIPRFRMDFCILIGNRLAAGLNDSVSYFAPSTDTSFSFQMEGRYCPFIQGPHKSNHVSYRVVLFPDIRHTDDLDSDQFLSNLEAAVDRCAHPVMYPHCYDSNCATQRERMAFPQWSDELANQLVAYAAKLREHTIAERARRTKPLQQVLNFIEWPARGDSAP